MKKVKKFLAGGALSCALLMGSVSLVDAATYNYASNYFDYGVYLGGGYGQTFELDGKARFIGTQAPYYSNSACGVGYQIRSTDGTVLKVSWKYGAGSIDTGNDLNGYNGKKKAYLRNAYNESTPQTASGKFYYYLNP
ncbi:hypothetical protein HPJ92_05300 [Anoxybacillus flavithermus]|nr:hypothetical protein [Anoxybacillus flavithermus]MBE2931967.1 hypothetical protein [Anoxybacillus flavithermus]